MLDVEEIVNSVDWQAHLSRSGEFLIPEQFNPESASQYIDIELMEIILASEQVAYASFLSVEYFLDGMTRHVPVEIDNVMRNQSSLDEETQIKISAAIGYGRIAYIISKGIHIISAIETEVGEVKNPIEDLEKGLSYLIRTNPNLVHISNIHILLSDMRSDSRSMEFSAHQVTYNLIKKGQLNRMYRAMSAFSEVDLRNNNQALHRAGLMGFQLGKQHHQRLIGYSE